MYVLVLVIALVMQQDSTYDISLESSECVENECVDRNLYSQISDARWANVQKISKDSVRWYRLPRVQTTEVYGRRC